MACTQSHIQKSILVVHSGNSVHSGPIYLSAVNECTRMSHSQPINYIVYSVRKKTCTAPDRFIYFLDYHCIGQQGISSFILYANQTDQYERGLYIGSPCMMVPSKFGVVNV